MHAAFLAFALIFSANTYPEDQGVIVNNDYDLVEINEVWGKSSRAVYLVYYNYSPIQRDYVSQCEVRILGYYKIEDKELKNSEKWEQSAKLKLDITELENGGLKVKYTESIPYIQNPKWVEADPEDWGFNILGKKLTGQWQHTTIVREITAKAVKRRVTWEHSSHTLNRRIYPNETRQELTDPYESIIDTFLMFQEG